MPPEAQPGAEPVSPGQPQEGQGTEGAGEGGLYDAILEGIPDEYHESLTNRLKEKDADFTKRFTEVSDRWKPYEEAGVPDADPEQLSGWMNLSQYLDAATQGDQQAAAAVQQWWNELGDSLGFFQEEGGEGGAEPQDLLDLTPDKLNEMVGEQIAQNVTPLIERLDQQEQQRLVDEAREEINNDLSQIRKDNPDLTEDDEKYIMALAWQFGQDSENPIQTGLEEFKRLVNRGESNLFAQKANQPAAAEAGGTPDTAAPAPTSENAKDLALERLKQMQAT